MHAKAMLLGSFAFPQRASRCSACLAHASTCATRDAEDSNAPHLVRQRLVHACQKRAPKEHDVHQVAVRQERVILWQGGNIQGQQGAPQGL